MREDFSDAEQMEKTWEQRLEEARREKHRETAEATCQTAEPEAGGGGVTVQDLDSRLRAQKQQLQLEADKAKHKAVEDARKQIQRKLHKKHLEDMAKQVSASFTMFCSRLFVGCWREQRRRSHFRLKAQ